MIYAAYEAQTAIFDLMRPFASIMAANLRLPWPGVIPRQLRGIAGHLDVFTNLRVTGVRPQFALEPVPSGNDLIPVIEEKVISTPFATLMRFRMEGRTEQPKVLVAAPMSGHFATLLRATVQTLVRDHDVYLTDWHNIRDVPLEAGPFDFSAYVNHVIQFMQHIGAGTHLVAVCQPTVPALAAAAIMAENDDPAQPASMILMAGPIDTRINPTAVNKLALEKPIEWFEDKLTDRVPLYYKGGGRRVYPGFMQLTAFMAMNGERHQKSFKDMAQALADGDDAKYKTMQNFYEEYFAVMDLPAEFYLETVRAVFQDHELPKGLLKVNGRLVDPKAIRKTAVLTVEGERDDICGLGQTLAAQELCSSVRAYKKTHHVQTGVGHYGVFSGRKWNQEIYPKVRDTIQMAS
ncbi:MAG: polyhydroxyalkanoate depolymerase [Beijerinckiaceae bacterium]|jgi:polyhydroxyalkanoate depolymerase